MTQDELKTEVYYKDGHLFWVNPLKHKQKEGQSVGYLATSGYIKTKINSKSYLVHRLVFLYHHGFLPNQIDHVNTKKHDNRIENLRVATHHENSLNKTNYKNSKSNIKGVSFHQKSGKWWAQIRLHGKHVYSELFDSLEKAEASIKRQRVVFNGDFSKD